MSTPIAPTIPNNVVTPDFEKSLPSEIKKPASKADIKIFYVDDDSSGLPEMIKITLGVKGFDPVNIILVNNKTSALETLENSGSAFHIMIFDGHIGDSWGWDILKEARMAAAKQGKVFTPHTALFTGDSTRDMPEEKLEAANEQDMYLVGDKDTDKLLILLDGISKVLLK